jgi:pantoate--beta-alanine ligase
MREVSEEREVRDWVAGARARGRRVAFVPTMGNLHAGHLALVERARGLADVTVVSIFVNPLQFSAGEDFAAYPRTPEADAGLLERTGADLLYTPSAAGLYPRGLEATTRVEVPGLGDTLCGAFRPGHFAGVATVVAILLNVVAPDLALFGVKDYQQLLVIRRLVEDLHLPVAVLAVPTVREPDGLAMSSRNAYLSAEERARAPVLYRVLQEAAARIGAGEADLARVEGEAAGALAAAGFRPDYVAVRRASDLDPPQPADRDLVVLAAAWLGDARLIDNLRCERPTPSPLPP